MLIHCTSFGQSDRDCGCWKMLFPHWTVGLWMSILIAWLVGLSQYIPSFSRCPYFENHEVHSVTLYMYLLLVSFPGSDTNFIGHLPCIAGGCDKLPTQRPKLPARIKIVHFPNIRPVSTNTVDIFGIMHFILFVCFHKGFYLWVFSCRLKPIMKT